MIMKKIIIIALMSFLGTSAYTQMESSVNFSDETKHYLGLHLGSTTGLGFSYRYWPKLVGFQVTALPIFSKGGTYDVSTGLTLLYTLRDNNVVDFYSYFGQHLISRKYTDWVQDVSAPNGFKTVDVFETIYNLGVGVGFRLDSKYIDFNIQVGYGAYDVLNDFNTNIAGEIGLYYHL